MQKYRKKPVVIEAKQWFNLGDHPEVKQYERGGFCMGCHREFAHHGNVKTLEGWHIVCPGDWIVKGIQNELYPVKPDIFAKTYDKEK